MHIHSTYSDGSKTIPEIAGIANELDFDFLLFTDHNTLQPKFDGLEGWYDRILVGIGCEINDVSDMNHYLSFDINEEISNELPPHEYVSLVRRQGGFGIIAHPDEKRSALPQYPPFPWTVWESDQFDGIEIWNQMSEWMEGLTRRNKYWRAMHPRKAILAPTQETLGKWDRLNLERKVVGIGGVDAHAHIYKLWGFIRYRIFRYKVIFRTIRTHVLTKSQFSGAEEYKNDLKTVYDAIKNANCFVSNRYLGDARKFRAWIENANNCGIMGDEIVWKTNTVLNADIPKKSHVKLIYNGQHISDKYGNQLQFNIDKAGIYRLEVYQSNRPWIYTNHFRITE